MEESVTHPIEKVEVYTQYEDQIIRIEMKDGNVYFLNAKLIPDLAAIAEKMA